MSLSRSFMASTAFGLSLLATTANADLTAAEVWGDWRGYMEGMGYAVTATENAAGNTLSVSDIAVEINGGPDINSMVMRLGPLEFVQIGNGDVEVVMPDTMPISIDISPKSTQRPARIEMTYSQSGQRMIASGNAADMTYDYSADTFGLALAGLRVDGTDFDQNAARFSLTGDAVRSQTKVTVGETRGYDQALEWGNVVYDLHFKSPEGVEALSVNSTLQGVAFAGTSALPLEKMTQAQALTPLLNAGFAFNGNFSTQGTVTRVEVTSQEGVSKIKTGSESSTLVVAMDARGMHYDVSAEKVQIGAELAGLPFPLFAEMAKSGFEMRSPLLKSDDPQDFTLAFNMTDFTMSDIIWALFDPSGQLPRDPATIALGLSGKAKILIDAMDTKNVEQMAQSGAAPAEVNALKIDQLTVDAVGAQINATGDLTFDNTDKTTLPGIPKPVGDININLAGANALLDKLVAMGLLPNEQVMGARMMMGVFAVPGATPDTLKSTIVFNEAGQILANGQRIK